MSRVSLGGAVTFKVVPRSPRAARAALSALTLAGVLAATVAGCGSETSTAYRQPRLVVLYATCSLNRNYLAPYDAGVSYTPHLKRFAGEGLVFDRHMTETGVSGPSFASIFSGTQADRHQVYYHPRMLSDDLYLVAEAFRDHGYQTHFWSGHPMASASLNYGQGVLPEHTTVTEGADISRVRHRLAANDERFAAVLDALVADPTARTFVQVNFTLTHSPYHANVAPDVFDRFAEAHPRLMPDLSREEMQSYVDLYMAHRDGLTWNYPETVARLGLSAEDQGRLVQVLEMYYRMSVASLDEQFGGVLERIAQRGLTGESLVVFTADHGEALKREGLEFYWTHGKQFAPEVFTVPMIMRGAGAGIQRGRYAGVSRSIDVFPTLAGLCRLTLPDDVTLPGSDLSAAAQDLMAPPELTAWSHTALFSREEFARSAHLTLRNRLHPRHDPRLIWAQSRAGDRVHKLCRVREGEWTVSAFDWAKDPGELTDLYRPGHEADRPATERLTAYQQRLAAAYPEGGDAADLVPEDEKISRLKSLGYIN